MNNSNVSQNLPGSKADGSLGARRHFGDDLFFTITLVSGLLIIVLLIGIFVALNIQAIPAMKEFGWGFLSSMAWNPVTNQFGALPAIYGTLLSSILGLVIAVPVSLGSAIFLAELAPEWMEKPVSFLIEMLAAIPSVIIGLWGLFVMVPVIRIPVESWLGSNLGFLPLFQGPPFGVGFL
jgi:phosphate transport system permease protein